LTTYLLVGIMLFMNTVDTKQNILDIGETLIQQLGYNAFSYMDISRAVGIKKASIHHHFPKKEDLGAAIIEQHLRKLQIELQRLEAEKHTAKRKLVKAYRLILSITYDDEQKMCLGGMLASDMHTLPPIMKVKLKAFFDSLINWISQVVGIENNGREIAFQLASMIEGVLLLGRIYGIQELTSAIDAFIENIRI